LSGAEKAIKRLRDFLIVRTVVTGETTVPDGSYHVQNKKYSDVVGVTIAKMDIAHFMVQEAISPTLTGQAVVVGGHPSHQHVSQSIISLVK
jgi:hypothetical protein